VTHTLILSNKQTSVEEVLKSEPITSIISH